PDVGALPHDRRAVLRQRRGHPTVPPPRGLAPRVREARPRASLLQVAGDRPLAGVTRMGLRDYFRSIKDAAQTIGEGMAVTASHMVRKPVTLEYPDRLPDGIRVQDTLPFRYRGILEVDLEICTACLACERACT